MKKGKYKKLLQRIEDLETAVGDLQGTRDITDVPLTDKLIENEVKYTFTIPLFALPEEVNNPYDAIAAMETQSWERFNTRFENLPEQGGPYDD